MCNPINQELEPLSDEQPSYHEVSENGARKTKQATKKQRPCSTREYVAPWHDVWEALDQLDPFPDLAPRPIMSMRDKGRVLLIQIHPNLRSMKLM